MERPELTFLALCDCHGEVLKIEYYEWDDDCGEFTVSIYHEWAMSWWPRLKAAWRYFREGEFAFNAVELTPKDGKRLAEWLNALPGAEQKEAPCTQQS